MIEEAAEEEREEVSETEGEVVEDLVQGEDAVDLVAIAASMRALQIQLSVSAADCVPAFKDFSTKSATFFTVSNVFSENAVGCSEAGKFTQACEGEMVIESCLEKVSWNRVNSID